MYTNIPPNYPPFLPEPPVVHQPMPFHALQQAVVSFVHNQILLFEAVPAVFVHGLAQVDQWLFDVVLLAQGSRVEKSLPN